MKIKTIIIVSIMAAFLFSGCNSTKELNDESATQNNDDLNNLFEGKWILISINDFEVDSGKFENGSPTIEFKIENNKVFGYSGCNNYQGNYSFEDTENIFISQLVSTRMACLEMSIETQMLGILSNNNLLYSIDKNYLNLSNSNNDTLKFENAE